MSENPLESLLQAISKVSSSVQIHISKFMGFPSDDNNKNQKPIGNDHPFPFPFSSSSATHSKRNLSSSKVTGDSFLQQPTEQVLNKVNTANPVTKEELGRSTWTFLHTLAAQYPDNPTRQQKKDVKELMSILSRMYPCKECADHFKEVLRANPVQPGSHQEFSQWLCHVHNVVNRSLSKVVFPCERVDARWGKLECEQSACDLLGTTTDIGREVYQTR